MIDLSANSVDQRAMLRLGPIPAASMDAELALLYRTGGDGGMACNNPPNQWMLDRLAVGQSVFAVEWYGVPSRPRKAVGGIGLDTGKLSLPANFPRQYSLCHLRSLVGYICAVVAAREYGKQSGRKRNLNVGNRFIATLASRRSHMPATPDEKEDLQEFLKSFGPRPRGCYDHRDDYRGDRASSVLPLLLALLRCVSLTDYTSDPAEQRPEGSVVLIAPLGAILPDRQKGRRNTPGRY
jgi:hypothetical protein